MSTFRPDHNGECPRCPTCGGLDCVTERTPLFTSRKYRKQARTQRNPLMLRVRASMRLWECSRCAKGWTTFEEGG